jgi:hypothetical protein
MCSIKPLPIVFDYGLLLYVIVGFGEFYKGVAQPITFIAMTLNEIKLPRDRKLVDIELN